ncbi:YtxH-like protein [compost metagenome]
MLTAPKSGKETRADLKSKAHDLRDQADEAADAAKVKAADVADEVKYKAEDLRERTEHAIEGAKKGFRENR